jgi:hypothetical protein
MAAEEHIERRSVLKAAALMAPAALFATPAWGAAVQDGTLSTLMAAHERASSAFNSGAGAAEADGAAALAKRIAAMPARTPGDLLAKVRLLGTYGQYEFEAPDEGLDCALWHGLRADLERLCGGRP